MTYPQLRDPDVLILPRKRRTERNGRAAWKRRPLVVNGHPIIAVITFQRGIDPDYCHPHVEIGRARRAGEYTDDNAGDFTWRGKTLTLRYQMHRYEHVCPFTRKPREEYAPPSRGFLAPAGKWSRAYAGDMEMRLDEFGRDGARMIALVHRAMEAGTMQGRGSKAPCPDELTVLVVGLRRCGVEIRVYNERIRDLRTARDDERATGTERAA